MSQQLELSRPFNKQFVKPPPKGKHGDYVPHDVVNQRLIQIFGYPPTFTLREIVRNSEGKVVGCVCRMEVTIDGHNVVIEEAGDEGFGSNDGDSLKKAMSDAYKRAAMRLGCALHLWSQEDYFLFDRLSRLGESPSEHGGEPNAEKPSPEGGDSAHRDVASPTSASPQPTEQAATDPASVAPAQAPPEPWSKEEAQQQMDVPDGDSVLRLREMVDGDKRKENVLKAVASRVCINEGCMPPKGINGMADIAGLPAEALAEIVKLMEEKLAA